jgi:hypothetical protein
MLVMTVLEGRNQMPGIERVKLPEQNISPPTRIHFVPKHPSSISTFPISTRVYRSWYYRANHNPTFPSPVGHPSSEARALSCTTRRPRLHPCRKGAVEKRGLSAYVNVEKRPLKFSLRSCPALQMGKISIVKSSLDDSTKVLASWISQVAHLRRGRGGVIGRLSSATRETAFGP